MTDLLPCPACQSQKICTFEAAEGLFTVSCENDDSHFTVEVHGSTMAEAIERWNTRGLPHSEVQTVEQPIAWRMWPLPGDGKYQELTASHTVMTQRKAAGWFVGPLYAGVAQEVQQPPKAIDFLEWLIGFTGAVRTHPLNAYGNKILRDKLEEVGAELGIYTKASSVPSADREAGK